MVGSEKQVKWATTIRDRLVNDNEGNGHWPETFRAIESAAFFIDTRNLDIVRLQIAVSYLEQGYAPRDAARRAA